MNQPLSQLDAMYRAKWNKHGRKLPRERTPFANTTEELYRKTQELIKTIRDLDKEGSAET